MESINVNTQVNSVNENKQYLEIYDNVINTKTGGFIIETILACCCLCYLCGCKEKNK